MKYFIATYGCQANYADSERIAMRLESSGHKKTDKVEKADIVVINACSVRQSAMDRVYAKISRYKNKEIILAGCILLSDKKKLQNKVKEIWHPDEYFDLKPLRLKNDAAYVPIMTGCNNFCAYCAVPYTRGREKSRPADEIIAEVKNLISPPAGGGCKEIWLLGQNVNSYSGSAGNEFFNSLSLPSLRSGARPHLELKNPFPASLNFSQLLRIINTLHGNFKINFLTSHPKDMSDELIKTIAECEKVSKEIHLPLQSGDNTILRTMNRKYTIGHYKKLIKKIRKQIPGAKISTDIIVGFPVETKKQFENTRKAVKEIGFIKAYISKYSPRPGTAAAKLKNNVPVSEKKRRWQILNKIIKKCQNKN